MDESVTIRGAMSNAALKFHDILMRRFDPRQVKPPSVKPEGERLGIPDRGKAEAGERVTGLLPESFWEMPMPDDPQASVRAALIEERDGGR